jgi:hypothetical protein
MPRVLAYEDGGPTPRCVEGAYPVAPLHEPLLIEHAVGGEEILAVYVTDERLIAAEPHAHCAVV